MNFQVVSKILIRILSISALFLCICIFIAIYYQEPTKPFIYSFLITFSVALVLFLITTKEDVDIGKKEAFLSVSLSWIITSIVGTFPYIISGHIPSFADALFESVSGFSTTGASILTNIEALPKSMLLWRSLTHWIGGIGIIMLVIVVMPSLKMGSYSLFSMESSLQERVKPRVKELGYRLLVIYFGLTCIETLFLWLGDMQLFDSICHSMSTISTGGFSTKNTSIAGYSVYIQYIICLFMILSGTNFIILYFIAKGNFKKIKENEELKFYLLFIFVTGAFITGILYLNNTASFEESFRHGYFQVISTITGTGYATTDYLLWPKAGWIFMFFLLFAGGCMGSTSGGIKMGRHLILLKNIGQTFNLIIHPNSVKKIKLNNKTITPEDNNTIISFITLYFTFFLAGSIILILIGLDAKTAVSSIASAIGCVGPGIGTVGPVSNYAHLPDLAKYILSFFMILGRLEIYTLLILFIPSFWKKI